MIKRYFEEENLKRIKKDFSDLLKQVKDPTKELEFSIRENSFNIYYMGNSLSQVKFDKRENMYKIEISRKFFDGTPAYNPEFYSNCTLNKKGDRYCIKILPERERLHRFFQVKHLNAFKKKIKEVRFQEETAFEQSIIADNANRAGIIFIDRQICDKTWRKKMDLLALKQIQGNKYSFLVCEVKLGNNSELKDEVSEQLNRYVIHIKEYFDYYRKCYEEHYRQKKELRLINEPEYKSIEIVEKVEGLIIVGGYSGIAKLQLESLLKKYPDLNVKEFFYQL